MPKLNKTNKGFTLIELLVVISIIAILATLVFVALDPARRFEDARNARRWQDVNSILTAVHECIVDNDGLYDPCGVPAGTTGEIGTLSAVDLSTPLANYLRTIPEDPSGGTQEATGYFIDVNANNLVEISAPNAEGNPAPDIAVSR